MGTGSLVIPRVWFIELKRFAIQQSPRECCGIIATNKDDNVVTRLYPATNIANKPIQHYLVDPDEQQQIIETIIAKGWWPSAAYHSHTYSPALPSQDDIDRAIPDILYLIIGMSPGMTMRAYDINHGRVKEAQVEVV